MCVLVCAYAIPLVKRVIEKFNSVRWSGSISMAFWYAATELSKSSRRASAIPRFLAANERNDKQRRNVIPNLGATYDTA